MIAIAITLLVLELSVGSEGSSLRRLADSWPSYLAYFVSFATIGAAWLGHTSITDRLTKADLGLMRINLVVQLVIGFLPFPTKLVAESLHIGHGDRVYVTLYGLTLLALRVLLYAVDEYARRAGLFDERGAVGGLARPNLTFILVAYGIPLVIGLLLPWLAVVLYFVLAVILIWPFSSLEQLMSHNRR